MQRGGAQAEEVAGNGRNLNVNVGLLGHIDCGKTSIGAFQYDLQPALHH